MHVFIDVLLTVSANSMTCSGFCGLQLGLLALGTTAAALTESELPAYRGLQRAQSRFEQVIDSELYFGSPYNLRPAGALIQPYWALLNSPSSVELDGSFMYS